ncbi:MAG: molecular chaperone DnaJ [Oscillospiraceae bacterium]|jgi:molecular chaperone DnaJ|nr:molecular chaperone DnaJ [Oscillospiraceae bacterium]
MAEKRDYYEALGINRSASDDEIKKAFRKLAKQYHPDVNPGDKSAETRFKEINEAYEILSDSEKKGRYDAYGHAGVDPNFAASGGGFSGFGDLGDLGDLFGAFFGGGRSGASSATAPRRGGRVTASVTISFEEAAFGCDKDIEISRVEECENCSGSGAKPGTSAEKCTECGGSGVVTQARRTAFGVMQSTAECPKCGGRGKIIRTPCEKCRGAGRVRRRRSVTVKIPAGIDSGQAINMHGQGDAGINGGGGGDLYVGVSVRRHEIFEREGTSVLLEMPISFTKAALGGEAEVPTLDGKVKYTIPEGTQTGTTFRLRGKGIPSLRGGGRGDQLVTVRLKTPTHLTKEQKELLRQLEGITADSEREHGKKKKKK